MTKCAVINLSGNTGKTTLTKHLLTPQLGARRIQIEDTNTGDGEPDFELAAKKFQTLAAELNVSADEENFVIDIGASNAKAMIDHFSKLKSTRSSIDYWVVPVVSASKQKTDSINTVRALIEIEVEPKKIIVVMNNVEDIDSFEDDFRGIFALRKLGVVVADQAVLATDVFEMLKGDNRSVFDLANNPPDFKSLKQAARASSNASELDKVGRNMVMQDLAEAAADNLRSVFDSMGIKSTTVA